MFQSASSPGFIRCLLSICESIFRADVFTPACVTPSVVHLSTHHELRLRQALRRDGGEDPGFMAALPGCLRALPGQLPVFGGAQLGWDDLDRREAHGTVSSVPVGDTSASWLAPQTVLRFSHSCRLSALLWASYCISLTTWTSVDGVSRTSGGGKTHVAESLQTLHGSHDDLVVHPEAGRHIQAVHAVVRLLNPL